MGQHSGGIWDMKQSQLQIIAKILQINDVIRFKMPGSVTQCSS